MNEEELKLWFERILNRIIGKIEDDRNNSRMIINYCKKIKKELMEKQNE